MAIVLDGTSGINTPDLESAGPVTGTTGTFSGAVQASGVATNIYPLVSGTAVASTSGTSIDFTGIPSWAKRITVMFSGVSTNGTSPVQIQLGDSGGVETTGYLGSATRLGASTLVTNNYTAGFTILTDAAVLALQGALTIANVSGNAWVCSGVLGASGGTSTFVTGSSKTLSDTLTQVRITTVNGTDTFDAGTINIMYEG
jgi:hypothetical protein